MNSWLRLGNVPSFSRCWPLVLLALFLAGCGRNDIQVYTVPKERDSLEPWKLPAGWTKQPSEGIRVARFTVAGKSGPPADVSIIPMKGVQAGRGDLVNLWREQMHLAPVAEDALDGLTEKVPVGTIAGELYDMASTEPLIENKLKARILVAKVVSDSTTWIVKMSGEDELVKGEKPMFLAFLQSLNLEAVAAQPQAAGRMASTNSKRVPHAEGSAKPEWTVPAGWQEQPPSQMLLAKFTIPGDGGSKADVNISASEGDGGGVLANISRWRGQLGLPALPEAELEKQITTLDVAEGKAILVDMSGTDAKTGQPARLIGAIVPREGKTWFYKLMGNEQIAQREKAAFIQFFQTAKYPNG